MKIWRNPELESWNWRHYNLKMKLSELEEAFQIVSTLKNLTTSQWEQICQILLGLEDQRDQSSIH